MSTLSNNPLTPSAPGMIASGKALIIDVFSRFWFSIPDYQRPYLWGKEQVIDLLEDVWFATCNQPTKEYFLGSMVIQQTNFSAAQNYIEADLLDGQQRITTLLLIFAVLRDISTNQQLRQNCNSFICQEGDKFTGTPQKVRLQYLIRYLPNHFIQDIVIKDQGTLNRADLEVKSESTDLTEANMAKALLAIHNYFGKLTTNQIEDFAVFLFTKVLLIYVSSDNLQDAFRLFTILNNRGVPLTNADILKAWNLGAIPNSNDRATYAKIWESIEGEYGNDEFDRLLSHVRSIYVKDKARENLLTEFEDNIYKKGFLQKGRDTFNVIKEYAQIYDLLYWLNDEHDHLTNWFKNLITVMGWGIPSVEWVPPLLYFYKKFGVEENSLLDTFLLKLDNKFSADWLLQPSLTQRINNMNAILKEIEKATSPTSVIENKNIFQIDINRLTPILENNLYDKSYARYLLFKLEFLKKDHSSQFQDFKYLTIEHILPQNPDSGSQWRTDFTQEQIEHWVHKMGNLILLSRSKNSSLGNREFQDKKHKYFTKSVDALPNSLQIMQLNEWNLKLLQERHQQLTRELIAHYQKKG
ncbi:DUF262 domain-containing HNH endonuclease family protein [Xanthocytophaga agilis]|uniref:DUF262 domain-containing HNH endonuclease family protein n=1 Tax=Xanthocytophaga agilis TaxID=3048010 RepID=A0AAE3R1C1_9BACT|nr:DUF262 domain-containing HNH endonuclease family protein [Xanthocytophaga agilis]MDJ1501846.1 DUF262 domain-containing HNH endonuclease family protein [Xanthocytophaga agilis]